MAWLTALPLVGEIVKGVFGLVDQAVEDKDEANKLKAQLQTVFNNSDMTKFTTQIKSQVEVIVAEATGSWLQKNWRPMLMCLFGIIVANNYVVYPYLMLFSETAAATTQLPIPPNMWGLLKLGIGGYVVGRSVEKIAGAAGGAGALLNKAKKVLGGGN
ncbi:hypothetical protein KAR91_30150 [Candidatus Pacearchaeota archaeon]|nr:hypothetical protein [Candidatus Pacearchaeota archaeon]